MQFRSKYNISHVFEKFFPRRHAGYVYTFKQYL